MIDQQTVRVSALNNRVPGAVLGLKVIGAAVVVGLLALYLSVLGRGLLAAIVAAGLVTLLLLVTFDLDRPARGLIRSRRHRWNRSARRWSYRRPPDRRNEERAART